MFYALTCEIPLLVACGVDPVAEEGAAAEVAGAAVFDTGKGPIYEWAPYWPQLPLPNKWAMGNVAGIDVDARDHVWVLNRPLSILHGHEDDAAFPMPEAECCVPPPERFLYSGTGPATHTYDHYGMV